MSAYDFHMQGSTKKGILLVHGLTGSPAEMRFVGKALHKMGYTVTAPTLAGHCLDENALLATTYEDWVASVREAIRAFASTVDEVYLAGICVGGAVALSAAALEGDCVKGVTIFSPLLNYDGWNTPFYYRWAPRGIPLLARIPFINRIRFGEDDPYGIKSERIRKAIIGNGAGIAGTLPSFPLKALYQNFRLNRALASMLPTITIPTLLIHAREDDVGHPRNALAIQQLHGGRCDIAWLENSYHMIHVDQERHHVAALTADFFGRPADA
ncbi:MAG: alpha/beta fold hydrolase [Pseudomonadota bacterium]